MLIWMHRVDLQKESTEYVRVKISAKENGTIANPTGGTVEMAFMGSGEAPGVSDWKSASWEVDGSTYYARALVGPSGGVITLTPDSYTVWVKFGASPETPVKAVSRLYVQ